MTGEDPHGVHPAGEQGIAERNLDGGAGPLQREISLDPGGSTRLAEPHEVHQQLAQALHLEAHRPPRGQVVSDVLAQRAHDRAPGQGRARPRAAGSATAGDVPAQGRASGRSATSSTLA